MTHGFDRLTAALGDGYRLECELRSGGMTPVYLAEDPTTTAKASPRCPP